MKGGGRLIYVGAGTGGRMAAVDAAEIGPSYGLHGRVIAVLAGGVEGFTEGREYYEDNGGAGAAEVGILKPTVDDVVFGVSASGRTPYVLGGIAAGRAASSLTIGFACTAGSELGAASDLAIEVATGAEIVAGSTRLKAGSAQKCVLNAISTLVMVRLGRTYGNLMIDAVADNAKLRRRALRVVVQATGVDDGRAAQCWTRREVMRRLRSLHCWPESPQNGQKTPCGPQPVRSDTPLVLPTRGTNDTLR